MRRLAFAAFLFLVAATPALGDDIGRKHRIDEQISSLQGRRAGQQRQEQSLRAEVDEYTARIRGLESRVGDVSLRLETLQQDLGLRQKRLDALNRLYRLQTDRFEFLRAEYRRAVAVLNHRIVDIYESHPASSVDVVLGSRNLKEAIDEIEYLNEIGAQDHRIASAVATAKTDVRAQRARTRKLRKTVRGETAVISARAAQARDVRDQLVGARNDLADSRQARVTDLSRLTAAERAEAEEIDALQQASQAIAARIRAAEAQQGTSSAPSSSGLIWPVSGPVTSPFGWRWGRMHEGIDIGVGYGTPIRAAAAGVVIYCGWEEGYGNLTVIDHGGNLATAYGHQSSISVSCGQRVEQGQLIGYVGCTGHCFGPHLHFEVRVNGAPVDPLGYL
jgi:murein DD-endopeptidase MepM/ murein hydrolase activator NlpD